MTHNILFLCTANSARSILAEVLCNHLAPSTVAAYSAGSQPAGVVNPGAIAELEAHGLDACACESKSWDAFCTPDAPRLTHIITLCDSAANETCPVFPGTQEKLHWGLPDPASGRVSFAATYDALETSIRELLASLA